ncbi:MAG: hypothetical protein ACFHX7_14060 [Pseudomonadota bacterium]
MSMISTTGPLAAGQNIERRLSRVQAVAGSLFFLFLVMHLSNIAIAPLGAEAFNGYQAKLRKIYQQPILELVLVILPLVVHVAAGISLAVLRRGRRGRRALRQRVHTWAGVFLSLFIVEHVTATRGVSYFLGAYPGFEGVAFTFWWAPAYFYPYYFLLALAGFYHGTQGVRILLARVGVVTRAKYQVPMTLVAAVWIAVVLLALGGHLFEIGNPIDNDYARTYAELFDLDLSQ